MLKTVYIATSLDGLIARENGSIEWLINAPNPEKEDFGYDAFQQSIDVIIMGTGTFKMALAFDAWPYNSKKVILLSRNKIDLGKYKNEDIEISQLEPNKLIADLERRGFAHAYVDGGMVIQSFLRADLIDRLIITKIPILIGSGKPLFGAVEKDMIFQHVATTAFKNGFVQSEYKRLV